jgi:multiple sugar transport system substrate-binding protein
VQGSTGHPASTYEFLESIGPSFGLYNWGIVNTGTADKPNYKATTADGGGLDGETAKKALSFWIGLLKDAPPESTSSTWSEVATTFAAGRAAQGWVYGENAAWIATDADQSNVVGKVGVTLPPTADGVMADAEAGKGYIGYYDGGAFGIPHSSKNKEATLLWLQFIAQDSVQPDWAIAAPRITHTATFDDPKVVEMDAKLDGYYTLLKNDGKLFAGAPAFPFHGPVRETIDPFIHKAIAGELTPEEALDQAAVAVNAKLVELGYAQ